MKSWKVEGWKVEGWKFKRGQVTFPTPLEQVNLPNVATASSCRIALSDGAH
jgi:hypothetical protein